MSSLMETQADGSTTFFDPACSDSFAVSSQCVTCGHPALECVTCGHPALETLQTELDASRRDAKAARAAARAAEASRFEAVAARKAAEAVARRLQADENAVSGRLQQQAIDELKLVRAQADARAEADAQTQIRLEAELEERRAAALNATDAIDKLRQQVSELNESLVVTRQAEEAATRQVELLRAERTTMAQAHEAAGAIERKIKAMEGNELRDARREAREAREARDALAAAMRELRGKALARGEEKEGKSAKLPFEARKARKEAIEQRRRADATEAALGRARIHLAEVQSERERSHAECERLRAECKSLQAMCATCTCTATGRSDTERPGTGPKHDRAAAMAMSEGHGQPRPLHPAVTEGSEHMPTTHAPSAAKVTSAMATLLERSLLARAHQDEEPGAFGDAGSVMATGSVRSVQAVLSARSSAVTTSGSALRRGAER